MTPAVFLDRDGTLMEDREYLSDPAGVRVFPAAPLALAKLHAAGFRRFVVTNQSGIGRGWMSEHDYQAVTREFLRQLGEPGVDAIYHCPAKDDHPDRKPAPGMYLRAAAEWSVDLSRSWAVGDAPRDLIAGARAGCTGLILVRTGKPINERELQSDWIVVDDIAAAVDVICP